MGRLLRSRNKTWSATPVRSRLYDPEAGHYEAAIAAAQDQVKITQFQFIACVVKSFLSGTPQKYYWPRANLVQTTADKKDAAGNTVTYPVSCPVLSMPVDWEAVRPNRQVTDTLMHELGHSIGARRSLFARGRRPQHGCLGPDNRRIPIPHFSLPARPVILGWVQPGLDSRRSISQSLAHHVDKTG